jgi:hypothetical protein
MKVEQGSELVKGTAPLGGSIKLCLDTAAVNNGVISMQQDLCTDFIEHNVVASAAESGGDGSSMEEKLEALANVGDVSVSRSQVNIRNGGFTCTITFLRDTDGPCQQKDHFGLCNTPGNVPKLCHLQLKNLGHCREDATKAVSYNSNNSKAWYRLAKNWEEAGDAVESGLTAITARYMC